MNLQDEIRLYSDDKDIPVLLWLANRYHWPSEFRFVAKYSHELTPPPDNKIRRV